MSENEKKHTELPWDWNDSLLKSDGFVEIFTHIDVDGVSPIADVYRHLWSDSGPAINDEQAKANAEFIVRACNNYYELLEACRWILNDIESGQMQGRNSVSIQDSYSEKLKQAIAATTDE